MVEGRNIKLIMAFKTAPMQATTLGLVGNISIANIDL
jgi:predicted O-linked N-acetylglucosamine transferase (SPINDLY family)